MIGTATPYGMGVQVLQISVTAGNNEKPEIVPIVVVGGGRLGEGGLLVRRSRPWCDQSARQTVTIVPRYLGLSYVQVTTEKEYENARSQ